MIPKDRRKAGADIVADNLTTGDALFGFFAKKEENDQFFSYFQLVSFVSTANPQRSDHHTQIKSEP